MLEVIEYQQPLLRGKEALDGQPGGLAVQRCHPEGPGDRVRTWSPFAVAASETNHPPSRSSGSSPRATSTASRVLPTPPGPASETRRTLVGRSSLATASRSSLRPRVRVGGTAAGSLNLVRRGGERHLGRRHRRRGERRLLRQYRPLELTEALPRLDSELLDQCAAGVLVCLQGVSLAFAAVKREHQLPPEALSIRVVGDQPLELPHQLGVAAERELGTVGSSSAATRSSSAWIACWANGS